MMYLLITLSTFVANATEVANAPIPVFLKYGYSTILEFDEVPTQVVLGDSQSFQIEKLKTSVVIRPLVDESTSNMFIYFSKQDPRLFILSVSDESEPTLYRKFVSMKAIAEKAAAKIKKPIRYTRSTSLKKSLFDEKKDFLTIEIIMSADSKASISPLWNKVRLSYKSKTIKPFKTWAERQVVQKDSKVLARFIFKRPDVPRTLKDTKLLIPIKGYNTPVTLNMKGRG